MSNSIARFQISADEDFRIQFVFVGLSLAGRTLRMFVKERASDTIRATLTIGAGLTLDGTDTVTALVQQVTASAWTLGEFETDLHDVTGGANTRLVGGRTVYDKPGNLPYGVIGAKATIQWVVNKAIVTAIGGIGPTGPANSLAIGTVTSLPTGSAATATITGTAPSQTLNLGLPRGATGAASTVPGPANSLAIGTVATGAPGSAAAASITGTAPSQTLGLTIPQGLPGTGGNTSEILAAAGIPEQPNLVVDFARREYFARGAGSALSVPALLTAIGGASAFTRASTATYFDSDGLLKTAPTGVPRVDYDPVTRACRGFLKEPTRTNQALRSAEFTNAVWGKIGATVAAGVANAPDGTLSMNSFIEDVSLGQHRLNQSSLAVTSGTTYTYSIFASERTNANKRYLIAMLQTAEFGANIRICADLAAGTYVTAGGTPVSVGMIPVGNGVYRIWVSHTAIATQNTQPICFITDNVSGSFANYTGDGASGFNIWGAQFEAGAIPSSYIPTVASTVTRAADALTIGAANWLNSSAGTLLVEAQTTDPNASSLIVAQVDGGNRDVAPYLRGLVTSSAGEETYAKWGAGVAVQVRPNVAANLASRIRYASRYSGTALGVTRDNRAPTSGVATDPAGPGALTRLIVGDGAFFAGGTVPMWVSRILFWPVDIGNTKLQSLSGISWPNTIISPPSIADGSKGGINVSGGGTDWQVAAGTIDDLKVAVPGTPAGGIADTKIRFDQAGTGAISRLLRDELRETVRPEQYWLAIDGNWTNAINRAVAYLQANSGGVLELSKRQYDISALISVSMTKPIIFRGQGRAVTVIRQTNGSAGGILFTHPTLQARGSSGVQNLTIEAGAGWDTASFMGTGSSGCGLRVENAGDCFATFGIAIHNFAYGLRVEGCWNNVFLDGRILFCEQSAILVGGDTSFSAAGGNKFIGWKPSNNGFTGTNTTSSGLRIRQSGGDFFVSIDITSFNNGVLVDPAAGKQVAYCFFSQVLADTSASDGWRLDASAGGIYSLEAVDCWGSYSTGSGLITLGGNLDSLDLLGFRARENGLHGARFEAGKNIAWHAGGAARNSQTTTNTRSGIYVGDGVDGCRLDTRSGNYASGTTKMQAEGLEISSGALNVNWSGSDFRNPGTGKAPVANASSSSTNFAIGSLPIQTGSNRNVSALLSASTTASVPAGTATYLGCHGANAASNLTAWIPGRPGVVTQMLIAADTAPGAGQSFTYELYKNGAATGLTASITGAATFVAAATSPIVAVNPTDALTIRLVTSAGAASANQRYALNVDQ